MDIEPAYADAHYGLADVLEEASDVEGAAVHWRAYLALEDQGPHAEYACQRVAALRPSG